MQAAAAGGLTKGTDVAAEACEGGHGADRLALEGALDGRSEQADATIGERGSDAVLDGVLGVVAITLAAVSASHLVSVAADHAIGCVAGRFRILWEVRICEEASSEI